MDVGVNAYRSLSFAKTGLPSSITWSGGTVALGVLVRREPLGLPSALRMAWSKGAGYGMPPRRATHLIVAERRLL